MTKPEAQHYLGLVSVLGCAAGTSPENVSAEYKKGLYYLDRAAAQGIAHASFTLGVIYHSGRGVKADMDRAISYYHAAVQQGYGKALPVLLDAIECAGTLYGEDRAKQIAAGLITQEGRPRSEWAFQVPLTFGSQCLN